MNGSTHLRERLGGAHRLELAATGVRSGVADAFFERGLVRTPSVSTNHTVAVILGAGSGDRLGHTVNKVFLSLHGEPIIVRAARPFVSAPEIDRVVVVASAREIEMCKQLCREAELGPVDVIAGGTTRHASEEIALEFLAPDIEAGDIELVLIHDAARPLFRGESLRELIDEARLTGGAILALPLGDRIVEQGPDGHYRVGNGDHLWGAQTPQAFRAGPLLEAFRAARQERFQGTDTSSTAERFGMGVSVVRGHPLNLKITYADDVVVAEAILESMPGAGG
jgi:2-C-methyl-D-erythritol 4-phosphate cytidylyltransferase